MKVCTQVFQSGNERKKKRPDTYKEKEPSIAVLDSLLKTLAFSDCRCYSPNFLNLVVLLGTN